MIANYPEIFLAEYLATQLPRLAAEFLFLNSMRIPQKFSRLCHLWVKVSNEEDFRIIINQTLQLWTQLHILD